MNRLPDKQILKNMQNTKKDLETWVKLCYTMVDNDPLFDYRREFRSILDDHKIIVCEFSSKSFTSRTSYDNPKSYYWSCCNSRKKNHRPDLQHANEILCVQKSD